MDLSGNLNLTRHGKGDALYFHHVALIDANIEPLVNAEYPRLRKMSDAMDCQFTSNPCSF